jgi:alpha-tubulin suppressor-like RCC1 family protein
MTISTAFLESNASSRLLGVNYGANTSLELAQAAIGTDILAAQQNQGLQRNYPGIGSFPAATANNQGLVITDQYTNTPYINVTGSSWSPLVPTGFSTYSDNSSTNFATNFQVNRAINIANAAINLAEVQSGGNLFIWGNGGSGQLGLGSTVTVSTPVQLPGASTWKQIAIGTDTQVTEALDAFVLAVRTDATLWGWGYNGTNQIGSTGSSSPINIGGTTLWRSCAASTTGVSHMISYSDQLFAMGKGANGELGFGTGNLSTPTVIGSLRFKMIHGAQLCSAGITIDGSLYTWGNSTAAAYGALGQGTSSATVSTPVQVGSLTNWSTVTCGYYHMFAIKTDGTLWSWGQAASGQLGQGQTTTNISSPVQVGTSNNWVQIATFQGASSYATTLGLKSDGTLWWWGNGTNKAGAGAVSGASTPVQVGTATNWRQITMGQQVSLGIKTDGTLWSWGNADSNGALGQGSTAVSISTPVQIGTSTNWKSVVASADTCVALQWPFNANTSSIASLVFNQDTVAVGNTAYII